MKELSYVLLGCFVFTLFFSTVVYPDLEHKNVQSKSSCTGMCYTSYVAQNGTVVEQLEVQQQLSNKDEFSSIRSLWKGCSSCHGNEGQGMSVFPKLSGRTSDYISNRLYSYKNRETVGNMSQTMWGQAGMLSSQQIETLSKYIETEL